MTPRTSWELLCQIAGRRDFLYVADCKLATTENMAHIHQHQGRFLTVLPRTRSEDGAFRDLLGSGQIQWRHIHDKRNDNGEISGQVFDLRAGFAERRRIPTGLVPQYAQSRAGSTRVISRSKRP